MIIAINFFIIAIILFGSNYLLLLEEMAAAARSMRADARISHWDSTVKCQAWQAVFPVLPECANPALKAHEWPVHMLLLGGGAATALEAGGWDQRREPSAMPPLSRRGVGVGGGGAGCSGGRRGPAATVQHPRAQQTCQRAIAEKMY